MILKLLVLLTTTLIIRCESLLTESTSKPSIPRDLQELLDSLYMNGYIPEYILPEDELTETEKTEGEYLDFPELKNGQDDVFVPPESEYSKNNFHRKNIKARKRLIPDRYRIKKLSRIQPEILQPEISPEELRSDFLAHLDENNTGKELKSNSSIKLDFLIPIPERGVYSSKERSSSTEDCSSTVQSSSMEFCNPIEQSRSRGTSRSTTRKTTKHSKSKPTEPYKPEQNGRQNLEPIDRCEPKPTEPGDSRSNELGNSRPTEFCNVEPTAAGNPKQTEAGNSKPTEAGNSISFELCDVGPTEPMNNRNINPQWTTKIPNPQGSINNPDPQGCMDILNQLGPMNTSNPQESMNTTNQQGSMNTIDPQSCMDIPNPQGSMSTPNQQGSMNTNNSQECMDTFSIQGSTSTPSPQWSVSTNNSQECMDIPNQQGPTSTPNQQGSMTTIDPQSCMDIPNPQGSMSTPNPRGSMNTTNPQGSLKILNPQGPMNNPSPLERFINTSEHKGPMNWNNVNKGPTQYTTLKEFLFTISELPNTPKQPVFKANTTIQQPITFEIVSPTTEKNKQTFQFTVAMQPQLNATVKPVFEQQIRSMLGIQALPKQLPQLIINTKQPHKHLRVSALGVQPKKHTAFSSPMPRINRTIHALEQQTIRIQLENSSRRVHLKTIDKNIATNVVSLMSDPSSINKMEAEGLKTVIKPSISVNGEQTRIDETYFDKQSNNSSEIMQTSSQDVKNKERKYENQNFINNSAGKENVDSEKPKKKMFTFLNIFKKNKKNLPPNTPGQNSSTQTKRELIENSSNEFYRQLLEANAMTDNTDVERQYPIKQEFEEEETFNHKRKKK